MALSLGERTRADRGWAPCCLALRSATPQPFLLVWVLTFCEALELVEATSHAPKQTPDPGPPVHPQSAMATHPPSRDAP